MNIHERRKHSVLRDEDYHWELTRKQVKKIRQGYARGEDNQFISIQIKNVGLSPHEGKDLIVKTLKYWGIKAKCVVHGVNDYGYLQLTIVFL